MIRYLDSDSLVIVTNVSATFHCCSVQSSGKEKTFFILLHRRFASHHQLFPRVSLGLDGGDRCLSERHCEKPPVEVEVEVEVEAEAEAEAAALPKSKTTAHGTQPLGSQRLRPASR
jgi:hypothetical protein